MSDSSVPRRVESILEALGADTEFCEAVIGDLAEEFALRAGWDGPATARRWYHREALRVTPYLLRDWWRGLRRHDVSYFANVVACASVCTIGIEFVVAGVVHVVAVALGAGAGGIGAWLATPLGKMVIPPLVLLWTLGIGGFGGYIAARMGRRAPLPSAVAFGATWVGTITILNALLAQPASGHPVPLWFRIANMAALLAGAIAGGLLRAARPSRAG